MAHGNYRETTTERNDAAAQPLDGESTTLTGMVAHCRPAHGFIRKSVAKDQFFRARRRVGVCGNRGTRSAQASYA
jgi:hypothetical protein